MDFEHFLFSPNFSLGQRAAKFSLVAYYPEKNGYIKTSDIVGIHEVEGTTYIETRNSVYELSNHRRPYHLAEVKKYFDGESDSKEVFHHAVANEMPTKNGWKIY